MHHFIAPLGRKAQSRNIWYNQARELTTACFEMNQGLTHAEHLWRARYALRQQTALRSLSSSATIIRLPKLPLAPVIIHVVSTLVCMRDYSLRCFALVYFFYGLMQ